MRADAEMTPNFSATSRGTMRLMSARALPRQDLKTSMKLSQRSCGWSISSMSPSIEILRSLPETECTSMRAPGSSWPMMSIWPPMRPTLSDRTSSMSMTFGPSTIHFSSTTMFSNLIRDISR
jgi:hypothetical protein